MRWSNLRKSKKILFHVYALFLRKQGSLSTSVSAQFKNLMEGLQKEILAKKSTEAVQRAKQLEAMAKIHLRKTLLEKVRDFTVGIGVALFIAILIRQMWFELYEIPTGSMRPTFEEQDRLSVSKLAFGVNVPFDTSHFYFDPDLLKRNDVVIFTVDGMDFRDPDTVYFYLFPGKKLLVKRLIGKPGDTVYFYGGKIYGLDSAGKDITSELQLPELEKIDHIPFITFEGCVRTPSTPQEGVYSPVYLYQMNEQVARLFAVGGGRASGELLPKFSGNNPLAHYGDLWGINNFATARLLTKEQVRILTDQEPWEEAPLYLELRHHPSLAEARIGRDEWSRLRPMLGFSTSVIPLQEKDLKGLASNLYTSRFVVRQGACYRYGAMPKNGGDLFAPRLPGVPDGTYEFYYGKAYQIQWQGVRKELDKSHPLYRFDAQRFQLLFNLGMTFDTRFGPQMKGQYLFPPRYAYFFGGDLFVMGLPFLKKDDPILYSFIEREKKRQAMKTPRPYFPFLDSGAPLLSDGSLDLEKVMRYGLKVPAKSYLVLGDNHAGSGDSREFGFVPEGNLRGAPSFIFWPPGERWGKPNQPGYAFYNPGRVVVWTLAALATGGWAVWQRRRRRLPLVF